MLSLSQSEQGELSKYVLLWVQSIVSSPLPQIDIMPITTQLGFPDDKRIYPDKLHIFKIPETIHWL